MVRFSLSVLLSSLALVSASTSTSSTVSDGTRRHLSFDRYAGYVPSTQVTDIAAIDLDQLVFNEELSDRKLNHAMFVYEQGGHSGSFAVLKVNLGSASSFPTLGVGVTHTFFPAGTKVFGKTEGLEVVTGTLKNDLKWDATALDQDIEVKYSTSDRQFGYVDCQVGGLTASKKANRVGCFMGEGAVRLVLDGQQDSQGTEFEYEYDVRAGNKNSLTLQSLSTNATVSMKGPSGSYYKEYQLFLDYYGDKDYGDKWITAAARKTHTGFATGRGDSDFTLLTERPEQAEAMKKGAAYLNIWMEVVRELNEAVADCYANFEGAENSVDEAVAFYTGSLTTDKTEEGILLYALAEVRAHQLKTAGHLGNKDEGDAFINVDIMREFKSMQSFVLKGDPELCALAEESKDKIITLMKVPLIQGVMRYAYVRQNDSPDSLEEKERAEAEGATFAATVLPFVHKCGSREAKVIHDNMRLGSKTSFSDVKKALERTYKCMGITCENIGGIWDHTNQSYESGAGPCVGDGSSSKSSAGPAVASVLGISVGVLLAGWAFLRYRHLLGGRRSRKSMPPMYAGNIAAVTEIA